MHKFPSLICPMVIEIFPKGEGERKAVKAEMNF